MADDKDRRFAVLWTARGRQKHSAVMTRPEAETFAARLRLEDTAGVTIHEGAEKARPDQFDQLIRTFDRW
ncbi:MAG: hypothetical protein FJW24_11610 [Acidimicrobiia bacterium]|nr:hypothetical protein [Acidimicrobiia bacterium]